MKARKLPELFFCRIQIVKGRFKAKVYGIEGAVNLGKPLEPHEVRETLGNGYLDLHSLDLEAIQDYIDKIMEKRKTGDLSSPKAIEKPIKLTPLRDGLKRLGQEIKSQK